ncbi:MAG TPA: DUF302 domain-containing protein [Acidobacteriota bacterium]|nr:DUF302 domain-containing protein [Acidobacteriota bacterium]
MAEPSSSQTGIDVGYGYGRVLDLPFAAAVQKARESLKSEGFGVLCEIDIKEKLKEKLGVEFVNYLILGACNPPLAYGALQQEINIGLLLPCNVVVYEKGSTVFVAAVDAARMLSIVGNSALAPTADQVSQKLRRVIDHL